MRKLATLKSGQRELGRKGVKAACKKLYETCGGKVYNTSGYRMFGNTKGLPDLIVFLPLHGKRVVLWHEAKGETGSPSAAQALFATFAETSETVYVIGGVEEAKTALRALGVLG